MSKRIEMIGKKYGRLTVLSKLPYEKQTRYLCRCDCGTEKVFQGANIRNGVSLSCGCLRREKTAEYNSKTKRTHNMSKTREYKIWAGMIARCSVDHPRNSAHYGSGIKVCSRWMVFENFIADMGARPSSRHSIDRIDNKGNYEPGNCRWATSSTQTRNTRYNIYVEHNGQTKILADWADEFGISRATIYWRYRKGMRGDVLFAKVK